MNEKSSTLNDFFFLVWCDFITDDMFLTLFLSEGSVSVAATLPFFWASQMVCNIVGFKSVRGMFLASQFKFQS